MPSMNLRVVLSCVSFETVMVVKPVQFYRADKAYLLHYARVAPYTDFLKEVETQLKPIVKECECVKVNINQFKDVLKTILNIIRKEKALGNHVYVNMSAGPNVFSAAALVACGMEGAVPFNVGVKEYSVKDLKMYYDGDRPVGLAKDVFDPYPLPEFEIKAPKPDLVKGLRAFQQLAAQKSIMSTRNIICKLEREGLMADVSEREGVKQAAVMKYRRNFLEPWLRNGWLAKDGKKAALTEKGKSIIEIFE